MSYSDVLITVLAAGPDDAKVHGVGGSSATLAVRSNALTALMQPRGGQLTSASAVRSIAGKRRHVIPASDDSFNRQREQELFEGVYPVAADVKLERCEDDDCTRVLLPLSALGAHHICLMLTLIEGATSQFAVVQLTTLVSVSEVVNGTFIFTSMLHIFPHGMFGCSIMVDMLF